VAQRVRAILAQATAVDPDVAAPADSAPGWLPGDDFTSEVSTVASGSPLTVRSTPPPSAWPSPQARPSSLSSSPLPSSPSQSPTQTPPPEVAVARVGVLERFAARLPVRIDPGRPGAMAVGAAVIVAALLTGAWVFSSRPHAVTVSATGPAGASPVASTAPAAGSTVPGPTAGGSPASSALLVVDVAGKVRRPGLYRLPPGSRIDDAVHAAGGALPGVDLTPLNLAAKVTDGQQIAVGRPGAGPNVGAEGTAGAAGSGPAALVDLNSATLEQLETLPGVGPVLGQHILDWRTAHGQFATVEQLRDVSGIGDVKFAALRSRVTV
jgi:competence protein ComEA